MQTLSFTYENPLKINLGDEVFKALPQEPGVYFFVDERRNPLYVGKADNLRRRVQSYRTLKPGYAQEHILEMIELAHDLVFEVHPTGEKALLRESELIRALRPPFNIAGNFSNPHLYCALRVREERTSGPLHVVDFRLSHLEPEADFRAYGCFSNRGKTKSGYSALLRLFHAATVQGSRLNLPARLCRTSPAYVYRGHLRSEWLEPVDDFLRGKNPRLLHALMENLLANEALAPLLYAPLQRDLKTARLFFEAGPRKTSRLLEGRKGIVTQEAMDETLRRESIRVMRSLKAKPRKPIRASAVS